jgi:energy-coupling factor transporter ATP-binding protein EcfA2
VPALNTPRIRRGRKLKSPVSLRGPRQYQDVSLFAGDFDFVLLETMARLADKGSKMALTPLNSGHSKSPVIDSLIKPAAPVRVTEIRVTKLFGLFNHTIPLRTADRITIIHGPNGYGKTVILQMVQALLTNQTSVFRRVPFESFLLSFDTGAQLEVTKRLKANGEKNEPHLSLHYQLRDKDRHLDHSIDYPGRGRVRFPLDFIERHLPDMERIGADTWLQLSTGRRLDLDDVIDVYGDFLPGGFRKSRKIPDWLADLPKDFEVRVIEAQRLMSVADRRRNVRPEGHYAYEPAVASYSRDLAERIQQKQAQYGTFSQQLDSTFPTRVLQKKVSHTTVPELTAKLKELADKRLRVVDAGLLTKEPYEPPIVDPQGQVDESTKGILSLYAEDVENKLSVFDEMTARIDLFKELVNKRFSFKQLNVERDRGFVLSSRTGDQLFPIDLSSGEQHELVLLYELLFRTPQNALVLIDEPELSLHVAWQVEFLKDLERVIKLSCFDVILATHSPQIINNRWDLTVELQGSE